MSTSKSGLVRETPSEKKRYDWQAIASELEADPGEWYKVYDKDRHSLVIAIRNHDIKALLPENGFESMTRNNNRGSPQSDPPVPRTCTLYLRYMPEKDQRRATGKKVKDAPTSNG